MMRLSLGSDPEAAGAVADQLTARLDEIWRHDPKADVDLQAVSYAGKWVTEFEMAAYRGG